MFGKAVSKIEDARVNLDAMRNAQDAIRFKSAFQSFLSNCRAVTFALQKEGKRLALFPDWYKHKQKEMREDELLRLIHDMRTDDFHEGEHHLQFGTHVEHLSTESVGPPPEPNASLRIGPDGPYWVVYRGTPQERRIPIVEGSSHTISVGLKTPPKTHRGQQLSDVSPVTLCQLAITYMEDLVYEAREVCRGKNPY